MGLAFSFRHKNLMQLFVCSCIVKDYHLFCICTTGTLADMIWGAPMNSLHLLHLRPHRRKNISMTPFSHSQSPFWHTYITMKLHTPESTSDITKKVSDHVCLPVPVMLQPIDVIVLVSWQIITFPFFKSYQVFMRLMWGTYNGIVCTADMIWYTFYAYCVCNVNPLFIIYAICQLKKDTITPLSTYR